MEGKEFLDLAQEIVAGGSERHWRGAHIHAYYALFLEARDTLTSWGLPAPPQHTVHTFVRLKFTYASNADCKRIGYALDFLSQRRHWASYQLTPHRSFASEAFARRSMREAADALALLDAIEADPARRSSAIASLPP
jgi:hypothetical protein